MSIASEQLLRDLISQVKDQNAEGFASLREDIREVKNGLSEVRRNVQQSAENIARLQTRADSMTERLTASEREIERLYDLLNTHNEDISVKLDLLEKDVSKNTWIRGSLVWALGVIFSALVSVVTGLIQI
jgi:chromosome segregation ATPase